MEELDLNVSLPPFLNRRRQFTAAKANQACCVIKRRWVVEVVNARIKQFKFVLNTVQNSSLPYLEQYLSIVCVIINKYRPPIKKSMPENIEIGQKMIALHNQKKNIQNSNCNRT